MEFAEIRERLFSAEMGKQLICVPAIYAALCGAVNLAAFVVFQVYVPTALALGCGAIAALCGILTDCVVSDDDGTLLENMPVPGAIGSFATAFFAGITAGLSLYAVGMFAISHIALKMYHGSQPD